MGTLLVSALLVALVFFVPHVGAVSLKMAPLRYQTVLAQSGKQKGYVDVSNPTSQTINLKFEVQAFRQIDDQGGVEFYDDKAISAGVLLDLDAIDLAPYEALRLYFLIDGKKLPSGEVFAAILARTIPNDTDGVAQAVRVGTILEITNGQAGAHQASISSFTAPFLQIGEQITARFVVKNDATSTSGGGFRPQLSFSVKPYSAQEVEGPLVFADRSRTVDYKASGNYFGFVWLEVGTGSSSKGALSFVVTGYWRWLGPMVVFAVISLIFALRFSSHKKH